ncbi:terminase large subunit domain-containing protein [Chitinophaga sp. Hz27]|uniref:terminase large subunit domain-containing protein n=1 Tax=Chitinophaga sp. Hz27 TaxID=3347169 RepID=UPI0035E15DA3
MAEKGPVKPIKVIKPQKGYQENALSSPADIVIGGAAAGVGKTWTLLVHPLRDIDLPRFGGTIFRRTTPQIRRQGGLWDASTEIYPAVGARPRETTLQWIFNSGAKVEFSHIEHEKNLIDWQGSEIAYIGFDELTHFSKKMFWYLISRNRTTCGVRPYVMGTCNPDPDSWVKEFIQWWIDPDTGYPIPERNGVVRYMVRDGERYIWGDTQAEVIEAAWHVLEEQVTKSGRRPEDFVKSVTFISGSIYDNQELLDNDPGYLANLMAQDEQTRMQLLGGNWNTRPNEDDIYEYKAFAGMFDDLFEVDKEGHCIIADIALEGSNKLTVSYWMGWEMVDLVIVDKNKGDKVIEVIADMAKRYKVSNTDIVFDADGVGGFVDGFIPGAIPFHGGASVVEVEDLVSSKFIKENYFNLRTQCYYRSGNRVTRGEVRICERVADMMYDDNTTVRQRFFNERKAIKKSPTNTDGKKRIIKKSEMKVILGNSESPDLTDLLMMREYKDLTPTLQTGVW